MIYTHFTNIADSSTVTDDVANYAMHGIFSTNYYYDVFLVLLVGFNTIY